jgi:hypothetical protein
MTIACEIAITVSSSNFPELAAPNSSTWRSRKAGNIEMLIHDDLPSSDWIVSTWPRARLSRSVLGE